jgi:dTDP-4-dehydrorhamnose 3,5-epimerase
LNSSILGVNPYSWLPHVDARGKWQRVWDPKNFAELGENLLAEQISVSTNPLTGTLRGLHYLEEIAGEWKAVICVQGKVQDVVVDMRESSSTYRAHQSFHLDGDSNDGLLVPPGCAHGFLTLSPNTILIYIMSVPYDFELERALRWDDPALAISWDAVPKLVSERDQNHELIDS